MVLLGLGCLLLGVGFLWSTVFPPSRTWTEEKANRMTELSNNAHKLLFVAKNAKTNPRPGGPTPTEAQAAYDEAKAELDTLKAEFESARDTPTTTGTYLRYLGIALALGGGFAHMSARGDA